VDEKLSRIRDPGDHRFRHPIMNQRKQCGAVVVGNLAVVTDVECNTPLDSRDDIESTVARDIRRLRRPCGYRPEAWNDEEVDIARNVIVGFDRPVCQQPVERFALVIVKRARDLDEMPESRGEPRDCVSRSNGRERGQKFRYSKRRQRRAAAQGENFGHTPL
jgi:hypothetical protein